MKCESENEEVNLFVRKLDESGQEDEDWDDSHLISAYDKALSTAKLQILRKIQKELNLTNDEVQDLMGDNVTTSTNTKNKKKKCNAKKKWEVGNSCRAVYSEDGLEYEAIIVKLIDSNLCVVRFVGYENEEEILLKELMPSLGKHMVQRQIEAADNNAQAEITAGLAYEDEEDSHTERKTSAQEDTYNCGVDPRHLSHLPPNFGSFPKHFCPPDHTWNASDPQKFRHPLRPSLLYQSIPPPPPPPPSFMNPGIGTHAHQTDESFDAMVLSWYMCGYYTGYYHRDLKKRASSRHNY